MVSAEVKGMKRKGPVKIIICVMENVYGSQEHDTAKCTDATEMKAMP